MPTLPRARLMSHFRVRAPSLTRLLGRSVARLYGLMVTVTLPVAVLPWESSTSMGKLKVPARVGVPVRTLS
jgi:hypothetical protein